MPSPVPLLHGTSFQCRYGLLSLAVQGGKIKSLDCAAGGKVPKSPGDSPDADALSPFVDRILSYLEGKSLGDLPLAPEGTPFQKKVWEALRRIPRGRVASYAEVARTIGLPSGARAVAQACGANPIIFLIPCHRVVASDGTLGGYGPGLKLKASVLGDEGVRIEKRGTLWTITGMYGSARAVSKHDSLVQRPGVSDAWDRRESGASRRDSRETPRAPRRV
jgi:O-6-methylguanine DNA methyltransferase